MEATAGTAAKAAGAVAAGGGPEDPVGDAAAAGIVVKDTVASKGAQKGVKDSATEASKSGGGGGSKGGKDGGKKAPAKGARKGPGKAGKKKGVVSWAWSGKRQLLTGQFVACMIVLILGTIAAPADSKDTAMRAVVKGSALSALFLLLALTTTGGKGASKGATALGTLITASYLFTSSDMKNMITWTAKFFAKPTAEEQASSAAGSEESAAGAEEGAQ
jgi:hypothetical protein